ncbi:MAG: DNA topoisomerase IB [Chitinophagales bacterium]
MEKLLTADKTNVMLAATKNIEELPRKMIRRIGKDPIKAAETINLIYVTDTTPGIARERKGKTFHYRAGDVEIDDPVQLDRIKKLVIPPAWENVWICKSEKGHLQVTGYDLLKRKQYRYHPLWNLLRNQTKYYRLHAFGKALPALRLQMEKDLSLPGIPQEKVLAAVVSLMERTTIRVGSSSYEKLYGSFGLSTLKDRHVSVDGSRIRFAFKGKKGVHHNISLKNKKLAAIVKKCKEVPGKELFQYMDESGGYHIIDSGMVNDYIRKYAGSDYTSKDLRTWAGSLQALIAFRELGPGENATETKKKIVEALDQVSSHLGNTRTVCKKYYVHPIIISLYENNKLQSYLQQLDKIETDDGKSGLAAEEKVLMKILETSLA